MLPYLREHFGNPSSGHAYGRRAREAVERARAQVAALLGCDDDEVIFTSGGTEANNLAIRGVAEARGERRHVVTTVIEHPATARPCAWLERHGTRVTRIGVDVDGGRAWEARAAIDADTALVTVMHSNNETGVLQPIAEIAELAHGARSCTRTPPSRLEKSRSKCASWGSTCFPSPATSSTRPRASARSTSGAARRGSLRARRGPRARSAARHRERGRDRRTRHGVRVAGRDMEPVAAALPPCGTICGQRLEAAVPGVEINGHRALRLPNTLNVRFPRASGNAILAGAPESPPPRARPATPGRKRVRSHSRNGHRSRRRSRFGSAHARSRHNGGRHRATANELVRSWRGAAAARGG